MGRAEHDLQQHVRAAVQDGRDYVALVLPLVGQRELAAGIADRVRRLLELPAGADFHLRIRRAEDRCARSGREDEGSGEGGG